MSEQCQGTGHCPLELRVPGPSWEQSEEGQCGVTGALGQRVLGGQEPEKVNMNLVQFGCFWNHKLSRAGVTAIQG